MLSGYGNPQPSSLQGVDPRVRVLLATGFAFLLVSCNRWPVLLAGLALALLLVLLTRTAHRATLKRLTELNLFFLLLLFFMPLSTPGPAFFAWGTWRWSTTGLALALRIGLKANAVMLAMSALLTTMEPAHLGHALYRLRVPQKLVQIFLFMIRYIDVIDFEYRRLRNAMKLRAFRAGCNLHALRSLGYLVGMLFLRSLDRADRIAEAMKCRGFDGHFYVLERFRVTARDLGAAAAFLAALAGLAWMEWA